MGNKDIQYVVLIGVFIYLLFSFVLGTLNHFDSWKFTRFIEAFVFFLCVYVYFKNKD